MPSPAGEGGRGPARGRMRGECAGYYPLTVCNGRFCPHQPPAGGSFSLRAKSRLRRLRFDPRLRAQPQGGKPHILERPTLSGRAFRAGVRNRKRRMAIVKGCNLTPGCVFTVRSGGAASKENGVVWAGCCLRGNNPSRRGAFYMRPSTGSLLRADTGSVPTKSAGENHSV